VKEAAKIKAFNASQFCYRLPEKVKETLRSEQRNRVDKNVNSKAKLKDVKSYISRQRRARENGDDKKQRKGKVMQPPST
jgi:hypothetical protein